MPRVTKGFDSVFGYAYTEKWAWSMCRSPIWEDMVDKIPLLNNQLANIVSLCNAVVSSIVVFCLYNGFYITGYVFLILRMYLDMLDGSVARECNMKSNFGNYLDHSIDTMFTIAVTLIVVYSSVPILFKIIIILLSLMVIYAMFVIIIHDDNGPDNPNFIEENLLIVESIVYMVIAIFLYIKK
mgnify:CR=1 FL=1|tara:strand:- start:165 stop:713 length:549 start_codon:yes stop_codon:yes gene_type:complete